MHSDRNRLLDRMTARFPAEKKVLLLAGKACVERKAYKRGLDYLDQALMLDRLDPAIPDHLVKTRLLQAREYFQKSRADDARKAMRQTTPFAVSTPGNLTRSRWCLKIQQGLMEATWGDPARGGTLLEEARQESPSEAAFLYYAGFADLEIGPRTARTSLYFDEFVRLKNRGASVALATALTHIWRHGKEWLADRVGHQPRELLEDYLRAAAKHPFSREEGSRLVEFCLAEDDFADAAIALVEKRLQEDASDPLFRFYRWRLRQWTVEPLPDNGRIELEEILAEATRRKEEQTVRQVRQQLDALKIPPPLPGESFPDDLPPEDDFVDLPDFGGGLPSLDELFGGPPPQGLQLMEEILNMIASAPEAELKRLKQTRPRGMSGAEFDMLVEMARAKRMSSNPDLPPDHFPPPSSPPPKSIPPPNPNQPELF
jgi:tetratricopeptide (TPR) repeat protein